MSAIDTLVPPVRRLQVGGREVVVEVLRMRQIPEFSRAIAAPWSAIVDGDYLLAIVECPDEVMQAITVATGLEAAFLADLRPDEFLALASAVFEVNLDFFARAVLPAARAMGAGMTKAMTSASLPGLSPLATATRTSLN